MEKIDFNNNNPPGISEEILEQLQNNIEEAINGIVIFQNENGVNSNIFFDDTIDVGDYIEIVYCRKRTDGTLIYKTTGKLKFKTDIEIALDLVHYTSSTVQATQTKYVKINSESLIVTGENTNSNGNITASNTIYITKIIKYN